LDDATLAHPGWMAKLDSAPLATGSNPDNHQKLQTNNISKEVASILLPSPRPKKNYKNKHLKWM
jgi:hypothetical protein